MTDYHSFAIGDTVRIQRGSLVVDGIVEAANNYGTVDDPNWYISMRSDNLTYTWKQKLDKGRVDLLEAAPGYGESGMWDVVVTQEMVDTHIGNNGTICPKCGEYVCDSSNGTACLEFGACSASFECEHCGSTWINVYPLGNIVELKEKVA